METLEKIDTTKLRDDGDTLELPNGRTLRLLITPDDGFTINEFDCYGRTEWVSKNWLGHHTRPESMDGQARVISSDYRSVCWWQPPADIAAEHISEILKSVRDIQEFGFQVWTLELLNGTDAYGRDVVVSYSTTGGIEPFTDSDCADSIVRDLLSELEEK